MLSFVSHQKMFIVCWESTEEEDRGGENEQNRMMTRLYNCFWIWTLRTAFILFLFIFE